MSGLNQNSYVYSGTDFTLCQEDSIVLAGGNAIIIWNSSSNKKDYIWSKRNGYCLATANYNKNLIAAAEYGLNPEVHIYKYPSKELVHKFKADTTIRCTDIVFSRDGRYLLMIGGIPDFKISIFDLENNKKVNLSRDEKGDTSNKLPCKPAEYRKAKFNPQNSKEFCILASNVIYFYKIHQAYEVADQGDGQAREPSEGERLSFIEYRNENPELTFSTFIWDQCKRIHVCTDLPLVLMIDSQYAKEENTLSVTGRPLGLLMTQRHLIVSTDDALVHWIRVIPPFEVVGESNQDLSIKVTEQIDQQFRLEPTQSQFNQQYEDDHNREVVNYMHYTKNFKKIIMGTTQGLIGILAVEAEIVNEDDEEDDQNLQKETKEILTPFVELGRFHTKKITGVKELGDTTQVVTVSEDLSLAVWEGTSGTQLARVRLFSKPTALDASKDGKVVFVSSDNGIVRVFDVSNRAMPRLIKTYKFYENQVSINNVRCSHDGKYVLVSSHESDTIFILSQETDLQFEVYGHIVMEGYVVSSCFAYHDAQIKVLAVLSNTTLAAVCLPSRIPDGSRMDPISDVITKPVYRRIDKGMTLVFSNVHNGDIFVTGDDKFLKKYEFPADPFTKMDFKKPPNAPIEELKSHDLQNTCWDFSNEIKFMATGGKDGNIILRNMNQITQSNEIKGHAVFSGGVTAMSFSRRRPILYTCGGEGALIAWNVGPKTNVQQQPVQDNSQKQEVEPIDKLESLQDIEDEFIQPFKEILLELFYNSQVDKKEKFKEEINSELSIIKQRLVELLEENQRVTDIEKLERDEFVIDVDKQTKIVQDGESICEDIRKEAEKTQLRLELTRERVQQTTWDKMEVQSKGVKSIKGDTLIFNYAIRKRTPEESRRLQQIINFRRMELREKISKLEQKLADVLDEADFSKVKEKYIMNRISGKPFYDEDQSVLDAAASFAAKDAEKKLKREKEEKKLAQAGQQVAQPGKRQPQLKITKGKLGQKTKKKDPDEELKNAQKDKMQAREIKGMEEMYWQVQYHIRNLEEMKHILDNPNIWDLIYESFELYTDPRKRMQIELLKEVIFELKRDYNKEFDSLEKFKEECLFTIKEKNDLIRELLTNLKQEEEIFEPQPHILEQPDSIFNVSPDEIKVEKFLTKEERAKADEERKKQLERELAMQGDNVGQRGLKTMMGGVELNLKKDQNQLQTELVREDWMNKPYDDLNDEEKYKLKEFEQKEKEFKEKQKKAWEQDLKKIKGEIIEIQLRFEERILSLFKKKLFYDVRVYEQELYLIRLTIMLHDAKETAIDEVKYREERDKLELEYKERDELISTFYNFQQDLENHQRNNTSIQEQEKELKRMFPDVNIKQILNFVRQGRSKKQQGAEVSQKEQEMMGKVVDTDPFSKIDKERIKVNLKEEDEKEVYNYERDNVAGLGEEDFAKLVEERQIRIEMEKGRTKLQNQIQQLKDHMTYLEQLRNDVHDKFQLSNAAFKKASERVEKLKYNFEVIVYLKQGQVEVPQLPVATDYKDAILIRRDVIEDENKEIHARGDKKVRLMKQISEFKTDLKKVRYQKKKLDLEILDFEERAKDVQLYRVTKQTQEIIQGKHQKKDEEDKKRLENQIRQLEENAQKRIKTINETKLKLKREIREKMMENEQLETKARQLQQNVDQRTQIMKLKTNTTNDAVQDPSKKIKDISYKRKLIDIFRQQNEELEFLKDELDRLRARTFPSFAHLHNKPEYPDEA